MILYNHQMIRKRLQSSLLRSSGIYTLTSILNASVPFFLLPILTRYLSPEEYGIVAMFSVVVGLVSPFVGLGVNGAITRKYYDQENVELSSYIYNCLLILLSSAVLVGVVFYSFGPFFSRITSIPENWLWAVILVSVAQFLIKINLAIWVAQVKPITFGLFQISQTVLRFGLAIVLVVVVAMGWQGQVGAVVISSGAFAVIGVYMLYKDGMVKVSLNKTYITQALEFGLPLIPHTLSIFLINMTDRLFITNMSGIEQTGIYVVGYQIGMIVNVFGDAFHKAWTPWLFSNLKKESLGSRLKVVKVSYLYIGVLMVMAVLVAVISPFLFGTVIAEEYSSSAQFVLWIAMGYFFNGVYRVFVDYIFFVERTKILATITFAVAILNIGLNYIFIKEFGPLGAAMATTLIYLAKGLVISIVANKYYPMPWNLKASV